MSALFILYKLCPAQLWISRGVLLFFPPLFDAGLFFTFFFFSFLSFLLLMQVLCFATPPLQNLFSSVLSQEGFPDQMKDQ